MYDATANLFWSVRKYAYETDLKVNAAKIPFFKNFWMSHMIIKGKYVTFTLWHVTPNNDVILGISVKHIHIALAIPIQMLVAKYA